MTTRRTFLATTALTAATHAFAAPKDNDIKHWGQVINSQEILVPDNITWATEPPVKPDENGRYPVAIPGTTIPV